MEQNIVVGLSDMIQNGRVHRRWSRCKVVVQQSGLCKWIRKLDGTVALVAKPDMVLTVEGYLGTGHTRIVVACPVCKYFVFGLQGCFDIFCLPS